MTDTLESEAVHVHCIMFEYLSVCDTSRERLYLLSAILEMCTSFMSLSEK